MNIKLQWKDSKKNFAVKIYTHNIRYATSSPFKEERPWNERKHLIASSILFNSFNQPTIVLLQEVLHKQLEDLLALLGHDWKFCGVARDDGKTKGEYAPILYKSTQFDVELNRTFWLSETPDFPSKGWDAASYRILNVAMLRYKPLDRVIYALNTHLDNEGENSRYESAKLIRRIISSLETHDILVLGGDLNSESDKTPYIELKQDLTDAFIAARSQYGNVNTFTGFGKNVRQQRIDYIFVSPNMSVESVGVLANRFDDNVLSSDHRPLVANIVAPEKSKSK
ncbi:Endonuclease/exonuclease/phosphatase [Lipomyces japonicus]|uniref:Endonuclease/exonuclease/phosphatase n=1 Tax=Lipomyces japonicus TaxID=56871 RepID=UPI0034CF2A4D